MALVAKQDLRDGMMMVARAGTVVSPAMVERHGWQDKVTDDGVTVSSSAEHLAKPTPPVKRTTRARKK